MAVEDDGSCSCFSSDGASFCLLPVSAVRRDGGGCSLHVMSADVRCSAVLCCRSQIPKNAVAMRKCSSESRRVVGASRSRPK